MSCFSPIGKFEYKSTISGVLYMGVVFLVIWRGERVRGKGTGPSQLPWQSRAAGPGAGQEAWPGRSHEALHGAPERAEHTGPAPWTRRIGNHDSGAQGSS